MNGSSISANREFASLNDVRKTLNDLKNSGELQSCHELRLVAVDGQMTRARSSTDTPQVTGTTVTKDVPDNALAIARIRQENKEGYASRLRARLKSSK